MKGPAALFKKYLALVIIYFCNCLPIKKNKIFFFSYYGSQYGDNPKYITEYILEKYPPGHYEMVWAFNDPNTKPQLPFKKVKTMSLKYFYELCTAKVIITNFRTTKFFVKRKGQFYIQTWHSSLRLKQIEKDAEEALPRHYVEMAQKDSAKCDLLLSGCRFSTETFRRCFWYSGPILEKGTPRNDVFWRGNLFKKEKILQALGLDPNENIILYAPTFRKSHDMSVYDLDVEALLDGVKSRLSGEWKLLVKLHPHLINTATKLGLEVMDVTKYEDIQELLYIADILITDYSSLMFDFALTKKPCFLYVPDIEAYMAGERKLYFDFNELPFLSARNNQELAEKIRMFSPRDYQRKLQHFLEKIGSYEEGAACEHLLQSIDEVCFGMKPRRKEARHEAV